MRILRLSLPFALFPSLALAHPGHGTGSFVAGLAHPLSGADHVLAMVAVGLLAAQIGGRALWALPLAFVGAMLAGGTMGQAGLPMPAVEPMILASVVILGVLVAMATRLPLAMSVPMIALFGAAHGWAHAAEGPAGGIAAFAAGFTLVTVGLHAAGIAAGRGLSAMALRGAGGIAAVAGIALAFT